MIWSLVADKIVTLEQLENSWSYDDLLRCHAFLEIKNALQHEQTKAKNVSRKISAN